MAVYSLDTRARSYGYDLFHGEVDVGLIRADVSAVDDQVYYTFVPYFAKWGAKVPYREYTRTFTKLRAAEYFALAYANECEEYYETAMEITHSFKQQLLEYASKYMKLELARLEEKNRKR